MHNNYIIAANSDLFNTVIPELPKETETTVSVSSEPLNLESEQSSAANSELSFVMGKIAISFGVMFLCILVIYGFYFFYKKRIKPDNNNYEYIETSNIKHNKRKRKNTLSTPASINQCIRAFLENTKKN